MARVDQTWCGRLEADSLIAPLLPQELSGQWNPYVWQAF